MSTFVNMSMNTFLLEVFISCKFQLRLCEIATDGCATILSHGKNLEFYFELTSCINVKSSINFNSFCFFCK